MRAITPALAALLGLSSLVACVQQRAGGEQREVAPSEGQEADESALACAPESADALALLEGPGCGAELRVAEGELELRARTRPGEGEGEVLGRGPAPERCGEDLSLCSFEGSVDALGPVVLGRVRGPESEVPVQVLVGWAAKGRVVFVDSWYGLGSVVDHTRVGPAWALAPHDCGGQLALLPAPRLPEAEHEAVPDELRALAGLWTVDEAGDARPPERGEDPAAADCRAVFLALP